MFLEQKKQHAQKLCHILVAFSRKKLYDQFHGKKSLKRKERSILSNIVKLRFLHGNCQCNTKTFHMDILITTTETTIIMELQ